MGKVLIDKYSIKDMNLLNDKRIAFISDIHDDTVRFEQIIKELKRLKIEILLLGGDIIDEPKDYLSNSGVKEQLKELSKTMKIYIGIGNHEMIYLDERKPEYRSFDKEKVKKYYDDLNTSKNIYVSSLPVGEATFNKWSLDSDIDISAINFPLEYYDKKESSEELMNYLDVINNIDIDTSKYNILLCHSPINLVEKCDTEVLKKFNLILSGHMHAGLVPKLLRKKKSGNGFVGPYSSFFPGYSYGLVQKYNLSFITSGGVVKISKSAPMGPFTNCMFVKNFINCFYYPEIEILELSHGENNIKKLKM